MPLRDTEGGAAASSRTLSSRSALHAPYNALSRAPTTSESHSLGRMIRSPGSPKRGRKGSGFLEEEERTDIFFFPLHSLVLVT